MADFIKVGQTANLKELLNLVAKSQERICYIDIPANSALWQQRALSLIKRASVELNKKIVLVSDSRVARIRAGQVGLNAVPASMIFKGNIRPPGAQPTVEKSGDTAPPELILRKASTIKKEDLRPKRKRRRVLFATSALFALGAGYFVSNYILQQAVITVYANADETKNSTDVVIDTSTLSLDFTNRTLPGIIYEETVTVSGNFEATGIESSGSRAEGTVIVNSSHSSTLTLRADTTYLFTPDGKRFRFLNHITGLRPGVPQELPITAEQPGSDKNLAVGTRLEIYNAVLGHQPQILSATVSGFGLMGGTDNNTTVVSESDLARAKDDLINKAIEQAGERIRLRNGQQDMVTPAVLTGVTVVDENFNVQAGQKISQFTASLTAQVRGLAVNRSDLEPILESELKKIISLPEVLTGLNKDFVYTVRSMDLEKGIAVLQVQYSGRVITEFDEQSLKVLLSGKTPEQIRDILLKKPEIASVRVDLAPFWLKSTPKDDTRIEIITESASS